LRIERFRQRVANGVARVEMEVHWEDLQREPLELYFETEERLAGQLTPDPNAALIACALPAFRDGEQRIAIEGRVCPVLARNLDVVFARVRMWSPDEFGATPVLEPSEGFAAVDPAEGNAIALVSGGIDSLATVRWNMLHVPPSHERAIGALAYVAFHREWEPSAALLRAETAGRRPAVDAVAAEIGADVIPIRTNSWGLVGNGHFFNDKWHGAAFVSAAAFLGSAYRRIYLAAGQDPWVDVPWGSHPMLDNYYSSAHLAVEHDLMISRFEKTRLVGAWETGRDAIRVCQNDSAGARNCGTCEKCIRTSLTLLVQGQLESRALPRDVRPEVVAYLDEYEMISPLPGFLEYYDALVPELRSVGRSDLADVLDGVLRKTRSRYGVATEPTPQ
jgi:hypothetical protein